MATKLTFEFQSGTAGWTESYFVGFDPSPGIVLGLPDQFWRGFFQPRGVSTVCNGVRLSDPDTPREGTFVGVNKRRASVGLPTNGVGDDPPSMAAELAGAAVGTRRTIAVRGLRDYAYTRDSSGVFTPDATVRSQFRVFELALIAGGFCLSHLLPANEDNPDVEVLSLQAGDGLGKTTHVTPSALGSIGPLPTRGERIVFHRLPAGIFPGLRSPTPVVSASEAAGVLLPVRWTGPTASVDTPGASFRVAAYDYRRIESAVIKDLRERRTGRPSGLSHGRRSGTHYRSR